jgi:hypothetical protein
MKWGIWERDGGWKLHVAPCDDNGFLKSGHTLNEYCKCDPDVNEVDQGRVVIVHREEVCV